MSISLDELLRLVGRLDDAPGFDTPRERFRRFLLERVTDVPTARTFVEDCQRAVGEQRHRALQDLVVLLGRLLRFEVRFGSYERGADGVKVGGRWRSGGQFEVLLELKTEQAGDASMEDLVRAVAETGAEPDSRVGLCVVARQHAARELNRLVGAQFPSVRLIAVRSLLSLADQVAADRLSHSDIVKLLRSGSGLDFLVELLERRATPSSESLTEIGLTAPAEHHEPAFWVATVTDSEMATSEQLLASVIAHRQVLAVCHAGRFRDDGSPGDWVCFFIPNKGIAGHAQLASIIEDCANVVRDASRFRHVYRLAHVTLYDQPIAHALSGERPFAVPPADVSLPGPCLTPIGRQDFLTLTTYRDGAANVEGPRSATA